MRININQIVEKRKCKHNFLCVTKEMYPNKNTNLLKYLNNN